jgi:hypothetical protein
MSCQVISTTLNNLHNIICSDEDITYSNLSPILSDLFTFLTQRDSNFHITIKNDDFLFPSKGNSNTLI